MWNHQVLENHVQAAENVFARANGFFSCSGGSLRLQKPPIPPQNICAGHFLEKQLRGGNVGGKAESLNTTVWQVDVDYVGIIFPLWILMEERQKPFIKTPVNCFKW